MTAIFIGVNARQPSAESPRCAASARLGRIARAPARVRSRRGARDGCDSRAAPTAAEASVAASRGATSTPHVSSTISFAPPSAEVTTGSPRSHRFNQADSERLGLDVRLAVDVGTGQQVRNVGPIAEKFNAIGNPERRRLRAERIHVLRLMRALRSTCQTAGPSRRGRAIARARRGARHALSAAPFC